MADPEEQKKKALEEAAAKAAVKKKEEEAAAKNKAEEEAHQLKEKELTDAATRYAEIHKLIGNDAEATKNFFGLMGTSGLKRDNAKEVDGKQDDKKEDERKGKDDKRAKDYDKPLPSTDIADRSNSEMGYGTRPAGYGATYISGGDWALKSIASVDNPAALEPRAWNIIMSANKIFHGYVIRPDGSLTRARSPVFQLKTMLVNNQPMQAISPDYEIYDAATISVVETSSEFEKSSVTNGFSATSWSAQGSMSAFGMGLSGGYARNTETTRNSNEGKVESKKEYTAVYAFPRARIFLDEIDLQLTPGAKADLMSLFDAHNKLKANVDNNQDADKDRALTIAVDLRDRFFARYGHIFSTVFQLGGELHASKSASSFGESTESQSRDAMKESAALSVNTKWVSFEGKYSNETNNSKGEKQSKVNNAGALAWSARGGNTLLAANPAEWANSVAGFASWRILQQDEVYLLPDLIKKFTLIHNEVPPASAYTFNFLNIPSMFEFINRHSYKLYPQVTTTSKWTGKIKLITNDARRLVRASDNTIQLSTDPHPLNEVEFKVLDGDSTNKTAEPKLAAVLAEYPLFLITQSSASRVGKLGSQIPGVYVDKDGNMKCETSTDQSQMVCRWSFRRKDVTIDNKGRWRANLTKPVLEHGEEVRLYCHSYKAGAFRSIDTTTSMKPPYWAPAVCRKSDDSKLRVQGPDLTAVNTVSSMVWLLSDPPCDFRTKNAEYIQRYVQQYDENSLAYAPQRELGVYENLWGWNSPDYQLTFSSSSTGNSWTTQARGASFNGNLLRPDEGFQEFHARKLREWMSATGYHEEVVFRVEYLYA